MKKLWELSTDKKISLQAIMLDSQVSSSELF